MSDHAVSVGRARQLLLGAAAAVVGGSTLLFGLLGAAGVGAAEQDEVAAAPDGDEPSAPGDAEPESPAPADDTGDTGTGDVGADDAGADDAGADDAAPPAEPDDGAASEDGPADVTVDPGDVSIQVLDADGEPGRAVTEAVAADLADAGYRVVVINDAVRGYAVTTVFWVGDNETAARELADRFGFRDVAPAPDNLATTVTLHVVVGADAG